MAVYSFGKQVNEGSKHDRMSSRSINRIERTVQQLEERHLALPMLLYLDAHQPLRFLVGQALSTAAPLAGLLGISALEEWAFVFNDPDAYAHLQQALGRAAKA